MSRAIAIGSAADPYQPNGLSSTTRHLAVVERFSAFVTREVDLDVVLQEACWIVRDMIAGTHVKVFQYRSDESVFVLQAGIGSRNLRLGQVCFKLGTGTAAGLAWHIRRPVFIHSVFADDDRRSLLPTSENCSFRIWAMPIRGSAPEAFGILQVVSRQAIAFSELDLLFLQAIGAMIGDAVEHEMGNDRREVVAIGRTGRGADKPMPV